MPITLDGTLGITTPSLTTDSFINTGGESLAGNLTFTSTGQRITGDMSTATLANRLSFQTSTTNGNTALQIIPNGTSVTSTLLQFNNSDPTNAAYGGMQVNISTTNILSGITGTGTYMPMTFTTGGSERMRIDTSGNVGIGTSSPSGKLDVRGVIWANYGQNGLGYVQTNGTNSDIQIVIATNLTSLTNTGGSGALAFGAGNAERMRIAAAGNVGIGTNNPTAFLHLYGTTADSSSQIIQNNGTSDAGIRFITTLADYKIGSGIGTATNSFVIYDIAASAQRVRVGSGGYNTIGSSLTNIARLAVQVDSSDGNLSDWGTGQFVVTRGSDTRGNGLGISFNDADNSVYFSALQPAVSWRNMNFRGAGFKFLTTGSTQSLVIDNTYSQVVAPQRHQFFASGSQSTAQPSGTTVIFPTVNDNVGSRYNAANGVFTAAIAGVYQFCFTGTAFAITNYFYGTFLINGVAQKAIWHLPATAQDYQFVSGSMTRYLNAGDTVAITMSYNGGAPYLELGSTGRNSFSGCLIG